MNYFYYHIGETNNPLGSQFVMKEFTFAKGSQFTILEPTDSSSSNSCIVPNCNL